jgi:hypothetical protein
MKTKCIICKEDADIYSNNNWYCLTCEWKLPENWIKCKKCGNIENKYQRHSNKISGLPICCKEEEELYLKNLRLRFGV